MSKPTFSLATCPWLTALTPDGVRQVSLHEAFTHSTSTTIATGGPLEDAATHRLLLAITYAALGAPTTEDYPQRFTKQHGHQVAHWLTDHQDTFDLLHPTAPFGQDPTQDGTPLPPGLLDPTLGRERATVTDHRPMSARDTMSLPEAALLLLVQQHYSVGGKHPGQSAAFPESSGTGLIEFRPTGTLAQAMTWARIPAPALGEGNWTWRDRPDTPGVRGSRPTGELDALTWLSRRITLHHDGTQITGAQMGPGWRRAPEADPKAPFDQHPGRRAMAVATDPAKPLKASPVEANGHRAGTGDPVDLTIAWERGTPTSLSGHVRAALEERPQLSPPTVAATGHQVISKALWAGGFTTTLPTIAGAHTDQAQAIIQARRTHRPFADNSGAHHLTTGNDEPDPEALAEDLRVARYVRPSVVPGWPHEALGLFSTTRSEDPAGAPSAPVSAADLGMDPHLDLAAVLAPVGGTVTATQAGSGGEDPALHGLRSAWAQLRADPDLADQIAQETRTRVPGTDVMPMARGLPVHQEPTRLWVGLVATWLSLRTSRLDASTPMPQALRWASRGGEVAAPKRIINTLARTAPTASALRLPLLEGVHALAASRWAPSWRALHYDLTHWNPTMARQWRTAFWN